MDCEMPILDGYQATEKIREYETENKLSNSPIIALTAHTLTEHREKSLAAGMNDHLTKPIAFDQLKFILLKWIH